MNGFLAVLRREIAERRMFLAAAAFVGLVPLAVPLSRGLSGADAADARSLTALILSAAFAAGIAIALGATMLAPRLANRRSAFDFARPLPAFALWGGRLAAATLLAILSAAIVWIPALITGGSALRGDLPFTLPVGGLLLLAAVVVLFALFHAIAVAVASRSARMALDAMLALAMGYGVSVALARLPRFLASGPFQIARISFAVAASIGLLVAGYASVARGRTDIQEAHRALSLALWVAVGAAALVVNAYALWVMAASSKDLGAISIVAPAPAGGWTVVGGPARGADATFLYDTASGRHARVHVVDWGWPVFSADGKRAAWIEGRDDGGPFPVWTWDLADPRAAPIRTRLLLNGYPSLTVLSEDGSRLATVEEGVLSIHDVAASRTLASARVADDSAYLRGFFVHNDRFRTYRVLDPQAKVSRLEIQELDISSRALVRTGVFESSGWLLLVADFSGDRIIVVPVQTKQTWLLDGRTGRLLAELAQAAPGVARWPGFLSDGRIVLSDASADGRVLRVFSQEGAPVREIAFPGAHGLALVGEAAPGQLIVAAGNGPERSIELVDVDTGESRQVGDHLYPAMRLWSFGNQPNLAPQVGSEATKLFFFLDRSLIRLDPLTGERRVILGADRAKPRSSETPRSSP